MFSRAPIGLDTPPAMVLAFGSAPWPGPDDERPAGSITLDVLEDGRATVRALLARFLCRRGPGAAADPLRDGVARRLCAELAVQLQIEEELLYPRLRDVLDDPSPIDQAEVEHECLRALSGRLMEMAPDDPLFDARVLVLGELLEVHLAREAQQLLPLLRRHAAPELGTLGLALLQRRDELLADLADGGRLENEEADPVGEPPR